jgi:hypothetical protein
MLTQNFYDGYVFPTTFPTELGYKENLTGFGSRYENRIDGKDFSAKGLLTGSEVAMLDNPNQKIYSVVYYDDKGQPVQTLSTNYLGGYDHDFFAYNFTGQPVLQRHTHCLSPSNSWTEF